MTSITPAELRELYRSWRAAGSRKGYGSIAAIYGCGQMTARDIVKGRTRGRM